MFNHQQNGGIPPQMVHMQRMMANRTPRSSAFMATAGEMHMNTPADVNDRRFPMGWTPQQQRSFTIAQQQQQNLLGFHGRSDFNNYGMIPQINPTVPHPTSGVSQMGNDNFIGSAGIRMPVFKCLECNIVKNSSEELEIHTKTEHLNWLPFICPLCNASRASDIQMREHMHSFHKKNDHKYFYHDNPQAKKILQEMMDKALFGASSRFKQLKRSACDDLTAASQQNGESAKKTRLNDVDDQRKAANTSKKPSDENPVKQAESSQSTSSAADTARQQSIDEETDAQLNAIFGRNVNVKSEFDMATLDGTTSPKMQSMLLPNEEDDLPDDNSHQLDALQNVAAMFSASGGGTDRRAGNNVGNQATFYHPKRIVRNRPGPMTSKKRILGECARCHKPITAGARQMHMFFHLGKDMKTFRFRCKHPGCPVEHYRKDQMENHQSKAHGRVDPNMMDDRTQELYNLVQKMSMELLGTMGNTPGPTAAKAQQLYDQQARDVYPNMVGTRRRMIRQTESPIDQGSSSSNRQMVDSANRKIEDLNCRICHKNIMSRIRGFHILWHLNNDLGIVRYGCKFCNFKHDRPQSVTAHGAREHGVEDCCEDLLYNFEDELKSMSKACFGVERLFEKEIRRRNKLEREGGATDGDRSPNMEEDDDSQTGSSDTKTRRSVRVAKLKVPLKPEKSSDRSWSSWTPKEQVKKRRSLRRFGTRKIKSRRQKEEMNKLREISMRLGGAQYFKKRSNEAVPCEKCGKLISNRLSDHAYSHLEDCDLFRCQQCSLGHFSRDTIVRHLRDFHNTSNEPPLDNRLRFAQEIKDAIRECYPSLFVDAPIPTKEDIEKLKANLKMENMVVVAHSEDDEEKEEEEEGEDDEEEEEDQTKEEEEDDGEEEETTGNDESGIQQGVEEDEEEEGGEEEMGEDEEEEERDDEEGDEEEGEDDQDYEDEEEEEDGGKSEGGEEDEDGEEGGDDTGGKKEKLKNPSRTKAGENEE